MNKEDSPKLLRKLQEKGLELAFYDSLISVINFSFFTKVIEDLSLVKKETKLSFEQILSRYESSKKFSQIGEIPKLTPAEFLTRTKKSIVWRENYQDTRFEDVPWPKLSNREIGITYMRETLLTATQIANGIKVEGFPTPHGRYSHRLQNFFQLRYRDACNDERSSNERFSALRAAIEDQTGYVIIWRSVFDEVSQAVSLGNPHLFALLTGIIDKEVGCFVMNGEC